MRRLLPMGFGLVLGCSAAADLGSSGGLGQDPGVGPGGAQDFGLFKQILEDGDLPGPQTIDDLGFFAEHKIDLPAADCGQDVCIHGLLGVMGNMINGANCTLIMLGMNTPIDPADLQRPPLNLTLAIDTSGSMQGTSISYVRQGLLRMVDALKAEDRVSIVTFADQATLVADQLGRDDNALLTAIADLDARGGTNLYDGVRTAFEQVEAHHGLDMQNRVILLSDGVATEGITNDARVAKLAAGYAELGYGISTIGVGSEFDVELMRGMAEGGSGSFYFLQNPQAVVEVFEEEVQAFLVPLAQDAEIVVDVGGAYSLRALYGTMLGTTAGNTAEIMIPSLQLAHRLADTDDAQGRRGGGGAILAEVVPHEQTPAAVDPSRVGTITFDYLTPDGEPMSQQVPVTSPLDPGETPEDGHFAAEPVEKAFVMLNIFAGFEMAATRASLGDLPGALNVLVALKENVEQWLVHNPDADIQDDLRYVCMFIENLEARGASDPPDPPPNPWPQD